MKPFSAFGAPGQWFRGNCHTHTTLSDGKCDPATTAALYRKKGYDFLVLTDHWATCDDTASLSTKGFLVVRGVEVHPPPLSPGFDHHLTILGVKKAPRKNAFKTAQAAVRWGLRQGALVYYAHPYWTGHDLSHLEEGRHALGLEVYNATCDVHRGLGYSEIHWDQVLSRGWRWRGLAVDDTHDHTRDGFAGWIMVKAKRLDERSILGAMRKGRFYATQGPEILDLSMKRGVISLRCSPVRQITWHANGPCGHHLTAKRGEVLEETAFAPNPRNTTYVRLEIKDAKGRKAWSNPIWRDPQSGRWVE